MRYRSKCGPTSSTPSPRMRMGQRSRRRRPTHTPLSYPAHAGYPVFQRPLDLISAFSGILDRPPSRAMIAGNDKTLVRVDGGGVLSPRPNVQHIAVLRPELLDPALAGCSVDAPSFAI